MRDDATFISIEVDDAVTGDAELAARLKEACPVDIYTQGPDGGLHIVHGNVDECILCALCLAAAPAGTVHVHKLYDDSELEV